MFRAICLAIALLARRARNTPLERRNERFRRRESPSSPMRTKATKRLIDEGKYEEALPYAERAYRFGTADLRPQATRTPPRSR